MITRISHASTPDEMRLEMVADLDRRIEKIREMARFRTLVDPKQSQTLIGALEDIRDDLANLKVINMEDAR